MKQIIENLNRFIYNLNNNKFFLGIAMITLNLGSKYLIMDSDNDYVLKHSPCAFLNEDNSCFIYEYRPKACREYPHTNRKDFHKISQITMKNIEICPAAFNIVEKLKLNLNNSSQKLS